VQFFRTAVAGWRHGPGQDASQESAHVAKITGELKLNKALQRLPSIRYLQHPTMPVARSGNEPEHYLPIVSRSLERMSRGLVAILRTSSREEKAALGENRLS